MISDVKTNTSKEVYDYIIKVGNRISQSKLDLIEETRSLFPDDVKMVTYPPEAEFLKMLVKLSNAKKGIEIGVFTGLSSLSIAEALPEHGKLYCLDISVDFTNLAQKYWKANKVDHKIELILGSALETLQSFLNNEENKESFDFAYIDADKVNYSKYFELLLKLLKPNGFIIFDNTLWSNQVVDESVNDEWTVALKNLNKSLRVDERVEINMLNFADGVTIVRKK